MLISSKQATNLKITMFVIFVAAIIFISGYRGPKTKLTWPYAVDAKHVYAVTCIDCWSRTYEKIITADVSTFRALGELYGVDKNRAYFRGREINGADPTSFEVLDSASYYQYSKDKGHVYMFDKVISSNPKAFHFLHETGNESYSADDSIYYNGDPINGADVQSFRVIKGQFSKDKSAAYCRGEAIPNADPSSFIVLDEQYGKDSSNVFFCSQYGDAKPFVIKGANVESFVVPASGRDVSRRADAYDKYRGYIDGVAVN